MFDHELKYEIFFDENPLPSIIFDRETLAIVDVNKEAVVHYGYTRDEFLTMTIKDLRPLEEIPAMMKGIAMSAAEVREIPFFRHKKKDGTLFDVIASARDLYSEGRSYRFVTFTDVTEKRKIEQALIKSEKKFRVMADLLPQTVFETDLTGQLTYVNKSAYKLFGYTEEEIGTDLNVLSMIAPEDRKIAAKNIQALINKEPTRGNEYLALKKDGTVFPIMIYSSLMEEDGKPVGFRGILIDLTDIRQSEDERIINESKFRAIYDQTSHLAGIVSKEGVLLETNRIARKFIGKDKSFYIGKLFWETPWWVHSSEAQELLKSGFKKALEGQFVRFETTHLNYKNELRHIDFSIKPVLDRFGKVICLIPEGRDITDRKKTEEALRQSEETFRVLAENSADTIMRFDREGRHLYVNPAVEKESGMGKKEFLGKTHEELGFPLDLCRIGHEGIQKVFETGEKHRIEFQLPNGNWVDWLLMPEFGKDREVKAVITSGRDITERKQADQILHLVQYGVNHSRDSIFWVGPETQIVYVNEAACKSLGYTKEELLSMKISEVDPDFPPEAWPPQLDRLRKYGSITRESHHKTKDGRIFPVEVTGNYVFFEGKEGSFAFARDITDRKQAEREREKLQEQLIQAQKMDSIGRLAGGVAHDFNNMLGAIIGYVELGLISSDKNPEMHGYLKQIQAAALRSADLTRQLLAFARKQTISPKVLDLNATVAGMLKMIQRLIGEDIELDFHPAAELWQVNLDPSQVDQLLMNLCVNARDAIAGIGRISIRTGNVSFSGDDWKAEGDSMPGDYVLVEVVDTGCGMDKEVLSHLFEPFFTTKETGKGTGLGLATVYGIVQQNNGMIKVETELGQGAAFRIYLPRYQVMTGEKANEDAEKSVKRGHETILLVEDESMLLKMTMEMLKRHGYRVLATEKPDDALGLAEQYAGEIDLLMTDVVMPEMNGKDLAEKLLSIYPGLKCLFMSGYTSSVIARHGVLDEGVNFIEKPFSMNELTVKVRQVLDMG